MNEMKEAVGNWREAKQFSPADENDFLRWLDKADTEEKLFSRLTFWFTFRGLPADQNQRYHLVQERARELRFWNGLELKLRRWQDRVADEYEQIGKEAFAARIGEDYAAYINSLTDPEAAPQQAAPEPETAKPAGVQAWSARELSEMELPPIRHVVEGLLPMGMGVLVAKPKLGKSWMVLDLCLAVAQGEPFLGFPTRQHGTLYLALEDPPAPLAGGKARPGQYARYVSGPAAGRGPAGNAGGVSGCQPGHPSGLHRYLIQDQAQGKAL